MISMLAESPKLPPWTLKVAVALCSQTCIAILQEQRKDTCWVSTEIEHVKPLREPWMSLNASIQTLGPDMYHNGSWTLVG